MQISPTEAMDRAKRSFGFSVGVTRRPDSSDASIAVNLGPVQAEHKTRINSLHCESRDKRG